MGVKGFAVAPACRLDPCDRQFPARVQGHSNTADQCVGAVPQRSLQQSPSAGDECHVHRRPRLHPPYVALTAPGHGCVAPRIVRQCDVEEPRRGAAHRKWRRPSGQRRGCRDRQHDRRRQRAQQPPRDDRRRPADHRASSPIPLCIGTTTLCAGGCRAIGHNPSWGRCFYVSRGAGVVNLSPEPSLGVERARSADEYGLFVGFITIPGAWSSHTVPPWAAAPTQRVPSR